jgi:hypothetical protein
MSRIQLLMTKHTKHKTTKQKKVMVKYEHIKATERYVEYSLDLIEAKKELQVCDFATKFSLMRLIEQIESKLAYHYKHPNFNFAIATAQVKQARRLLKL